MLRQTYECLQHKTQTTSTNMREKAFIKTRIPTLPTATLSRKSHEVTRPVKKDARVVAP